MACVQLALIVAALLSCLEPAVAQEKPRCLTREQQRTAIAEGKAIPLAQALRATQRRRNEVVRARLCQESERLIYRLTVLTRDGKVRLSAVDAANGAVVGER